MTQLVTVVKSLVIVGLLVLEWMAYALILRRMKGQRWGLSALMTYIILILPSILARMIAGLVVPQWFTNWLMNLLFLLPLVIPLGAIVIHLGMWILTAWSNWELARWWRKRRER